MKKIMITDEQITEAIESGKTMRKCSIDLDMKFMTFKRRAIAIGIYRPNQGRKGIERDSSEFKKFTIPLEHIIFENYGKAYTSSKLRKRLIKEGYKENKCEDCSINEWMGKELGLELHHKDGNKLNNQLENLAILCPNCHSLTPNHSIIKNKKAHLA